MAPLGTHHRKIARAMRSGGLITASEINAVIGTSSRAYTLKVLRRHCEEYRDAHGTVMPALFVEVRPDEVVSCRNPIRWELTAAGKLLARKRE